MNQITELIEGKCYVEVFGALPESVLNASAIQAIVLWDLECIDGNTLRMNIYESDLERFSQLVESCMCKMEVLNRSGGSSTKRKLKRRKPLLFLAILTLALLFLSSLFIWDIEVIGNKKLSRGQVLRALEECGVANGSYWPELSGDIVRSQMMNLLPDIAWMTLNVNGSRAIVLISERQEKPEIYSETGWEDVVAKKTGIISRVSVLNGKSVVLPGQAVTKGETLISGELLSLANGSRYVRACGEVMANTWYELSAVVPMQESIKDGGILRRRRLCVVLGSERLNLYFGSGKAIDECDKIIKEYKLGIDGLFALPIKLVAEDFVAYDLSQGEDIQRAELEKELLDLLSSQTCGEILNYSFTESAAKGLYILTLRGHCLENIGINENRAE